jgi:hypothetical protein
MSLITNLKWIGIPRRAMLEHPVKRAEPGMVQCQEKRVPSTIEDAVDVSARVLGLQLDLCAGSRVAIGGNRFAVGYLWGFCGGALTALRVLDASLYTVFDIVSRQLLAEGDARRILAGIPGMAAEASFQEGEAMGIADAIRCVERDQPPIGLVLHLSRS